MQHPETLCCSRRKFLRGSGLTLAGFGIASLLPTSLVQYAMAGGGSNNRRLLFIFLRGGNDGLNTIIPHGDPDYTAALRPTVYVSPEQAIDLNGFASLHPAMEQVADMFETGDLAAVHRVGYPNSTRSHFEGRRIWHNGNPAQGELFEGWLYRYIREHGLSQGATLPALSVQQNRPLVLRGDETFVNIANPDEFGYSIAAAQAGKYADTWRQAYAGQGDSLEPYGDLLSQTGVKLADTLDLYASWDQQNWNPKDPDSGDFLFPVDVATNPIDPATGEPRFPLHAFDFFRSLKVCALSMLESDPTNANGTRIAGTQLTGFDRHADQGSLQGYHPELLDFLAYGLRSLRLVLSGAADDPRNYASIWDDTAVITMSEFGRSSKENLSQGTDHGAASCVLVAGGNVNGGVYNCDAASWPSGVMFGIDGKFLELKTDYRAVFWEVLRDHMGAAPDRASVVFPDYASLGLAEHEIGLIGT